MFTQNKQKQQAVLCGITGSLICEINNGDYKNLKAFHKELESIDSIREFDPCLYRALKSQKSLSEVVKTLIKANNKLEYQNIKDQLNCFDIVCSGYVEQGRVITVYNSLDQLVIRCDKAVGPQIDSFLAKHFETEITHYQLDL